MQSGQPVEKSNHNHGLVLTAIWPLKLLHVADKRLDLHRCWINASITVMLIHRLDFIARPIGSSLGVTHRETEILLVSICLQSQRLSEHVGAPPVYL